MENLKEVIEASGKSLTEVGELVGLGKAAVSRIASGDYSDAPKRQAEIIGRMRNVGWLDKTDYKPEAQPKDAIKLDTTMFIPTDNVIALDGLAEDLLDRGTTLNASIGIVMGSAGYGKTTAVKHFCATHDDSFYMMYIQGFTDRQFVKSVADAMVGRYERTYYSNLELIKEAASAYRKLVIIDEADRMPQSYFDIVRDINETSGLPILLCGEGSLAIRMSRSPRLKSRIRRPQVCFSPLSIVDVATYWHEAVGLNISGDKDLCAELLKMSGGDFRILVNDAQHLVKVMNASGISTLSREVLHELK